ncbi:MAG: hypothetical protein AB8F78_18140 [Saprospiraceae bacterium]
MNRLIIALCFVSIISSGCANKLQRASIPMGITFVESTIEGLITLESTGFGPTTQAAELDAIREAFAAIMFEGIPQYTGLNRPFISNASTFEKSHPGFLDAFMGKGTFNQFVATSFPATVIGKVAKGKGVSKQLTINYKNFRTHLEQKGVIRKFGY